MLSGELICGYGDKELLRVPPLSLREGGTSLLVGENGSGKSTFLKTLCGILPALNESSTPLAGKGVLLPEEMEFPARVRAVDVLRIFGGREAVEAGETLGVGMTTAFADLSKGQKQKIKILATEFYGRNGELICLDEPLSGLDLPTRKILNDGWEGRGVLGGTLAAFRGHRIISQHSGETTRHGQVLLIKGGRLHVMKGITNCEQVFNL